MSNIRAMDTNLHYLRFLNMWPNEGESTSGKLYKIKWTICVCITLIPSLGGAISLIRQVKGLNNIGLLDILENLVVTIISVTYYYVGGFYMTKVDEIYKLYLEINDFSEFQKPPNFNNHNKKLNLFVKAYFCVIVCFSLGYCSYSLYEKEQCLEDNAKFKRDNICGLVGHMWMPFSLKEFPINQLFFLLQTLSSIYFISAGVHIFAMVFVALENITLRLDTLHSLLIKAFEETDILKKRTTFKYCVAYHVNIKMLVERVNTCFGSLLFATVTIYSVIMAIISFQMSKVLTLRYVGHLIGWLITFFVICWTGQKIADQSDNFNERLYELKWYLECPSFQRDFMLVLQSSQSPLQLSAGNFVTISFPTFLTVLRNTYTVVTLLTMALPDSNEEYFD